MTDLILYSRDVAPMIDKVLLERIQRRFPEFTEKMLAVVNPTDLLTQCLIMDASDLIDKISKKFE